MPLDAAYARFELADQHAVTEHGGVILDHRAPQPGDLLARLLAACVDPGVHSDQIRRDIGANIAQKFENQARRLPAQSNPRFAARGKMRFSGAAVEGAARLSLHPSPEG